MSDLLRPTTLVPPDFFICSPFYGTGLRPFQCYEAADGLATGSRSIIYDSASSHMPMQYVLPISLNHGNCWISVEQSGPNVPTMMQLSPDEIRKRAGAVIQTCVTNRAGIGGFATLGFNALSEYLLPPDPATLTSTFPTRASFITVTVSGAQKKLTKPGNTDSAIPAALAELDLKGYKSAEMNSALQLSYRRGVYWWTETAAEMARGGRSTWFPATSMANVQTPHDMAYECDDSLGSPSETDCSQLEWSQLGPPSDTVSVGPGNATFVHSNSCYLAISASTDLVLSWQQIRTAVEALLAICIMHPYSSPQGGRAYYQVQPSMIEGRRRKRDITGLNALPPHANVTVFEQSKPWTNLEDELTSCTWQAASSRRATSTCK